MKVRILDIHTNFGPLVDTKTGDILPRPAKTEKQMVFWCAGCGSFHGIDVKFFNGDVDNPTTHPHQGFEQKCVDAYFKFGDCAATVVSGVVHWSKTCKHRLAGQSQPLQHEESWRKQDVPWDAKIDPAPQAEVPSPDGGRTVASGESA